MSFQNLSYEIYFRIFEYIIDTEDYWFAVRKKKRTLFNLMTVCKACHVPAKISLYTEVNLTDNHRAFLAFLENQQDNSITEHTKTLIITSFGAYDGVNDYFIPFFQRLLPYLNTIEFKSSYSYRFISVILDQIAQSKQINRITSHIGDIRSYGRYFELAHNLRNTITNLLVDSFLPPQLKDNDPLVGLSFLSEFKSLTDLKIQSPLPKGLDFFNVLTSCPKPQSLTLWTSYFAPSSALPKELVVHNNLKHLKLRLARFPSHYLKCIPSCIPTKVNSFELEITDNTKYWIFSNRNMELIDQFSTYLGSIRNLTLNLDRREKRQGKDVSSQPMLERAWRFVSRIRGNHRQKKMNTSAEFELVPNIKTDGRNYCHFSVRKDKYFDFRVPFYGISSHDLQNVPVEDMEDSTMIHNISLYDREFPKEIDRVLKFLQYMVKRCSRLNRVFVSSSYNKLPNIVFAPTASAGPKDKSLLQIFATTPTEDNILYASYTYMALSNHVCKRRCNCFPKSKP